jgi:hypothetical protein
MSADRNVYPALVVCRRVPLFAYCIGHADCREKFWLEFEQKLARNTARGTPPPPKSRR